MEELLTLPGVGRKTANLVLILSFKSLQEHLRRHARASHLESPRLGATRARRKKPSRRSTRRRPTALVAVHQSVSRHLGTERLPAGISALRRLRDPAALSASRRHAVPGDRRTRDVRASDIPLRGRVLSSRSAAQQPRGSGDRRRDVEGHVRVRDLPGRRAEDRRAHRRPREARFLRWPAGSPRAAGIRRSSGAIRNRATLTKAPTGDAVRRRRAASPLASRRSRRSGSHTKGAVAIAHPGHADLADSQIYVTLANRPDLDGRYTVFGHVIDGDDVSSRLQRGDADYEDVREGVTACRSEGATFTTPASSGTWRRTPAGIRLRSARRAAS